MVTVRRCGGATVRRCGGAGSGHAALVHLPPRRLFRCVCPGRTGANAEVSACYHRRVSTLSRPAALQGSQAGATAAPGEGMPPRFQ